jgi:hypothetical protein
MEEHFDWKISKGSGMLGNFVVDDKIKEMGCQYVNWFELAQDRFQQ